MNGKPESLSTVVVPSDGATVASAPRVLHVFLGKWAFCGCWWLVIGFHAFLGGFALSVAVLHWYLQNKMPAGAMDAMGVPLVTLGVTAQAFLIVGILHFVVIVRVLLLSLQAKRLVLHASKTEKATPSRIGLVHRSRQVYSAMLNVWSQLFGPTGFFGFSNPHFETLFVLREGWEILLQTYQAYKLSQSVPRKWINQLAVAVIVLNCVSSPLVHLLYHKQKSRRRFINLLLDAVLDFCCSIVIPMSIFMPYVLVYDPEKGISSHLLMNDAWFVNGIAETRQVLVTSFPDFVSTVMPQLSLLGYLMTFKNLLRRRLTGVHDQQTNVISHEDKSDENLAPADRLVPQKDISVVPQQSHHKHRKPTRLRKLVGVATHVLFVLWGGGVLGLHLEAYRNTDRRIPGCQLHTSAWYSSRFPCSVMQVNCHVAQVDGSENELSLILDQLERTSLRVLIISHCPQLKMPAIVTEFDQLSGIDIFNSTLIEWSEQAAIRQETHPFIGYLYFVLTNWTTFPAGLLHDQLPAVLTNFILFASNVTELPDEIGLWSSQAWDAIIIERAPLLTRLPESFCGINSMVLWIAGSGLTSLPIQCATRDGLVQLGLYGSALSSLPDQIGPNVQYLFAENTPVAQLPEWFDGWYNSAPPKVVAFHGSALCASKELHEGMPLWDETCRSDLVEARSVYPIEVMLGFRAFDEVHVYSP